jgi:hypothetical protein
MENFPPFDWEHLQEIAPFKTFDIIKYQKIP